METQNQFGPWLCRLFISQQIVRSISTKMAIMLAILEHKTYTMQNWDLPIQ